MVNVIEKEMLSVSRMKLYLRCPLAFSMKYIQGISVPINGNMLIGKCVHKGAEIALKKKIDTKVDAPLDFLLDVYSTTFDEALKQEDVEFGEDDPGKLKDEGANCIKLYHSEIAPGIVPVAAEQKFVIEFQNVEYGFLGFIDVLDSEDYIHDLKVTKRSFSDSTAAEDLQLTAYCIGYKSLTSRHPKGVVFDVLVRNKTPKVQRIVAPPRTEEQLQRFLKLVGSVSESIKLGVFYPCEDSLRCSWCSYKSHCKSW